MKGRGIAIIIVSIALIWEGLYPPFGWWDLTSFVIVVLASILLMSINKWTLNGKFDLLKDKISIIISLIYALYWGISIYISYDDFVWKVLMVPILYGLIFSTIVSFISLKTEKKNEKHTH